MSLEDPTGGYESLETHRLQHERVRRRARRTHLGLVSIGLPLSLVWLLVRFFVCWGSDLGWRSELACHASGALLPVIVVVGVGFLVFALVPVYVLGDLWGEERRVRRMFRGFWELERWNKFHLAFVLFLILVFAALALALRFLLHLNFFTAG